MIYSFISFIASTFIRSVVLNSRVGLIETEIHYTSILVKKYAVKFVNSSQMSHMENQHIKIILLNYSNGLKYRNFFSYIQKCIK